MVLSRLLFPGVSLFGNVAHFRELGRVASSICWNRVACYNGLIIHIAARNSHHATGRIFKKDEGLRRYA